MRNSQRVLTDTNHDDLKEATRGFYLGEGYREADAIDEEEVAFRRDASWFDRVFGSKIERLPTRIGLRFGPQREEGRSVWIDATVNARWRLLTRLDALFFRIEAEHLERYLDTGRRGESVRRLNRIRRPVAMAAFSNLLLSTILVAFMGRVAGFSLLLIIGCALIVAFVNLISIVGFADLIIESMERL